MTIAQDFTVIELFFEYSLGKFSPIQSQNSGAVLQALADEYSEILTSEWIVRSRAEKT